MPVSLTKIWADGEQLLAADLNTQLGLVAAATQQVATQSEVNLGVSTTTSLTPNHNKIIIGTEASPSGQTACTFTGIPSGTRRITINFAGISTNGTSNVILTLGDSGGLETSGYLGACTTIAGATPSTGNFTAGFGLTNAVAAASVIHGTVTLTVEDATAFAWCYTSVLAFSNASTVNIGAGVKATSAELTQLSITMANGTDTFDAGSINITYER